MGGFASYSLALLAVAMLYGSPQDPQDRPADTVEDIIVQGVSPDVIDRYVDTLTVGRRRGQSRAQIARWTEPLCVQTIGGLDAANDAFSAQVKTAIVGLGVAVGGERCAANVVIVATRQPDAFSELFTQRQRIRYFQGRRSEYTPFVQADGPVRWAHSVDSQGTNAKIVDSAINDVGGGAPTISLPNTRLRFSTAARIRRSLIVVDQRKIGDVSLEALAAYVAMAIVVDLPLDFQAQGHDSILNLFGNNATVRVNEATALDRAFIQGVYNSDGFVAENLHRLAIARGVQRALTRSDENRLATGTPSSGTDR